jgi:small subunit ribosomal protein S1
MPAVDSLKPTTDDFAALLEESFAGTAMIEGRVVPATDTALGNDIITVDV